MAQTVERFVKIREEDKPGIIYFVNTFKYFAQYVNVLPAYLHLIKPVLPANKYEILERV